MLVFAKLSRYIYNTLLDYDENDRLYQIRVLLNTCDVGFIIRYGYTLWGSIWCKTKTYKNRNRRLVILTNTHNKKHIRITVYDSNDKCISIDINPNNICKFRIEFDDMALLHQILK
jgi:hypothetical protein